MCVGALCAQRVLPGRPRELPLPLLARCVRACAYACVRPCVRMRARVRVRVRACVCVCARWQGGPGLGQTGRCVPVCLCPQ